MAKNNRLPDTVLKIRKGTFLLFIFGPIRGVGKFVGADMHAGDLPLAIAPDECRRRYRV